MNAADIKKMAREFGADLVGIAPIERFAGLPKENNPMYIFPQAKTMIVLGRRIPRGALRGLEEGTEKGNSFDNFGFYMLEDQYLSKTTYDLCIWIEAQGFEAVPMFGYDIEATPKDALGTPVAPEKPGPNVYVDWKFAAQACGLGEIGRNGLFLTPEFGPRQRFAMLICDQGMEGDAVAAPSLCQDCRACIEACPLKALDDRECVAAGLADAGCRTAVRHNELCARCRNGAIQTNFGRFNTVDRIGASCGRACVAALESKGLLKNRFATPFRAAKPWGRDILGRNINPAQ